MSEQRLQKYLAGQGFGSRRQVEAMIAEGRITVDGEVAELGCKVIGGERIKVDGKPLRLPRNAQVRARTIVYNKPSGEICSRSDPEGRPTVFESLPHLAAGRWIGVGRLDFSTSGLLLFTTDGELANRLMHPSSELDREYAVRIDGEPDKATLTRLRKGIRLDDGPGRFEQLEFSGGEGRNRWYRVTVREGRNRLVRRLWEAAGHRVTRLIRVRYGPVSLPRALGAGKHRSLRPDEQDGLYAAVGLDAPART